jgi:hypothetical protein
VRIGKMHKCRWKGTRGGDTVWMWIESKHPIKHLSPQYDPQKIHICGSFRKTYFSPRHTLSWHYLLEPKVTIPQLIVAFHVVSCLLMYFFDFSLPSISTIFYIYEYMFFTLTLFSQSFHTSLHLFSTNY